MLSCDRKVLEDIFDMQPGDVKRLGVALEPPFFCDFVRGNNPPRGGGAVDEAMAEKLLSPLQGFHIKLSGKLCPCKHCEQL